MYINVSMYTLTYIYIYIHVHLYVNAMTLSDMCHDRCIGVDSFMCVPWLIQMCVMTNSDVCCVWCSAYCSACCSACCSVRYSVRFNVRCSVCCSVGYSVGWNVWHRCIVEFVRDIDAQRRTYLGACTHLGACLPRPPKRTKWLFVHL